MVVVVALSMVPDTHPRSQDLVRGRRKESLVHTVRACAMVTCILLCYTKITVNFCLPAEGRTAWLYSLWDTYGQY